MDVFGVFGVFFEEFIMDLLHYDILKVDRAQVRFIEHFYKFHWSSKIGVDSKVFFNALTASPYVIKWYRNRKGNMLFDPYQVDRLEQLRKRRYYENQEVATRSCYVERRCTLCRMMLPRRSLIQHHLTLQSHILREEYLVLRAYVGPSPLKLTLVEMNNLVSEMRINWNTCIVVQAKHPMRATIRAVNEDTKPIIVYQVIPINLEMEEPQMTVTFNRRIKLRRNEGFTIQLSGYFLTKQAFYVPVGIVCKKENEETSRCVEEIMIDVVLETVDDKLRGYMIRKLPRTFTEIFPIYKFKTPQEVQQRIRIMMEEHKDIIRKGATSWPTRNILRSLSTFLDIPTQITEKHYDRFLTVMLDIEENEINLGRVVHSRLTGARSRQARVQTPTYRAYRSGTKEMVPPIYFGSRVTVTKAHKGKEKNPVYRGRVLRVMLGSVDLQLEREIENFNDETIYTITFYWDRISMKLMKRAVFLTKRHDVIPYFFPNKPIHCMRYPPYSISKFFFINLNNEQQQAVRYILSIKHAPYLLFTPPGSGTTVTVIEAILQIWSNGLTALICAPTNAEINNLTKLLLSTFVIPSEDMYRFFDYSSGKKHIVPSEEVLPISNIRDNGKKILSVPMSKLLEYKIILTTLLTAGRLASNGVPGGHFDYLFIIGSEHATEAECLVPIAGVQTGAWNLGTVSAQVVLVGDPRQVGPSVRTNLGRVYGYEKSMMQRLLDTCEIYARNESIPEPYNRVHITRLRNTYVSHEAIMHVPNELFYHGELIVNASEYSHLFINSDFLLSPNFPVIFHHVEGAQVTHKDSNSLCNFEEIDVVVEYLTKLVGKQVRDLILTQEHIAVTTPYWKQAREIYNKFMRRDWRNIMIDKADGSQMPKEREKKLVAIISTVNSFKTSVKSIESRMQLGFLGDPRRFNSAVTRASSLVIVVGNGYILERDVYWRRLIEHCVANKSVTGEDFQLSDIVPKVAVEVLVGTPVRRACQSVITEEKGLDEAAAF